MRFRLVLMAGVLIAGGSLMGCGSGSESSSSGAESNTSAEADNTADPIEQARVVLDGNHSYDEVKDVTDRALQAAGESLTDENRSRAWSSILKTQSGLVEKGYASPDAYQVMGCVPGSIASHGVAFTAAVAYCSLEIAGIPESEW